MSAPIQTGAPLLYEHEDGRYLVARPTSPVIAGEPKWHRLGPVEVEADAAAPPLRAAAPGARTMRSGAADATALVAKLRFLDTTQFGRNDSGEEDDGRTVYLKAAEELRAALVDVFADAPAGDSPRATGFLLAIAYLIVNSDARAQALESEALASVFEPASHAEGASAEAEVWS